MDVLRMNFISTHAKVKAVVQTDEHIYVIHAHRKCNKSLSEVLYKKQEDIFAFIQDCE